MILTLIIDRISKAATVLSVLMKMYTVPRHDGGHINVMLDLQSCTDSLKVLPCSSTETIPAASIGTYDVANVKLEEEIDIKEEEIDIKEEDEVNVKAEEDVGSEEEERIDVKDEVDIYSEEEEGEDIHIKQYKDAEVKEEVSCEYAV